MHRIRGRFPLSDRMLKIPLTPKRKERMKTYSLTICAVPSDVTNYSLEQWQSPVKDQDGRGSCATFSFLGAIEARYRRQYNLAVDLSAEYFINVVFSTQPTCDPSLLHENICTDFLDQAENPNPPPDGNMTDGAVLMTEEKFLLPEMRFCPYFGVEHANDPAVYGITHSDADLDRIAADAGLISLNPPGSATPWNVLAPYTQQAVDNYYYDFRHIPLDARKNAYYGAEEIEFVTANDPATLESCIYGDNEVVVGMGLGKLDWGQGVVPGTYTNGQPVQMIGNVPVAIYPDQNLKDKKDANGVVIGKYGTNEDYQWNKNKGVWELVESGHSMIAVAFDTTHQLMLFKNSWGPGSLPYLWIPYQFIREKCGSAFVITKVRDPLLNKESLGEKYPWRAPIEEAMWLGFWNMDHDGWLGKLVIRHTRARGQGPATVARLGSYYDSNGVSHMVTGYIEFVRSVEYSGWSEYDFYVSVAHLWIDFDNPEGPPYSLSQNVVCQGQEFTLKMYGAYTAFRGDHAVGTTIWNGQRYGVVLSRPGKELNYVSGGFDIQQWNGEFIVFPADPVHTPYTMLITDLRLAQDGNYYVRVASQYSGFDTGLIRPDAPHCLEIYGPTLNGFLYYHTREVGLASGDAIASKSYYIGHKKNKELHVPTCGYAQVMASSHKAFFLNVDDALQVGYNGCYFCMRPYDNG